MLEHLADDQAILMVDETGDLKKGTRTVGVQRQYTGTAGRVENAQVAVYLTYTSRHGHAGIDRALYLPMSWTDSEERRAQAAVPDQASFATKPQRSRLDTALAAGQRSNNPQKNRASQAESSEVVVPEQSSCLLASLAREYSCVSDELQS